MKVQEMYLHKHLMSSGSDFCARPMKTFGDKTYRVNGLSRYRRAVESGLISHLNRHWRPDKPACSVKTEFRSVGTDTVLFAIWLLGAGMLTAAIIFAAEIILWSRYARVAVKTHFSNILFKI
jgi:hypothetical protein